jgi:N-acetyl-gamma-glutamyl-phosphate reductase
MRIAIVGASGYAGLELVRLLSTHPEATIVTVTGESSSGKRVATHAPALAGLVGDLTFAPTSAVHDTDVDTVFLALPHGQSQSLVPTLRERGVAVVDLGADFRLRNAEDYVTWYGEEHHAPHFLDEAVYGLVERHRTELVNAGLVAVPGCYPTATSLVMGPFVDAGLVDRHSLVVNALSGVSGAGRSPSERLHFPRMAGNAEAYGLTSHRHTVEMQREMGATVLFTPHLIPVSRGMLVTAYARTTSDLTTASALEHLRATYANDPCVVVVDEPPALKDAVGSNLCFVSARVDERTGWLVGLSAIDNLVKGAAGQAIQAWNVVNGFGETTGLPLTGVTP